MAETTQDNKLVGQNYTTPDLVAKVTGKAKYAEDYKADGMLFTKLLLSPMPHARVTRLDMSAALAMPGVKAILTADDLPGAQAGATLGENVVSSAQGERPLTMEPVYEGEPILAVAAVDELTAAEAIEKIVDRIRAAAVRRRRRQCCAGRRECPDAREYLDASAAPAAPAAGRAANAPAAGSRWLRERPQPPRAVEHGRARPKALLRRIVRRPARRQALPARARRHRQPPPPVRRRRPIPLARPPQVLRRLSGRGDAAGRGGRGARGGPGGPGGAAPPRHRSPS